MFPVCFSVTVVPEALMHQNKLGVFLNVPCSYCLRKSPVSVDSEKTKASLGPTVGVSAGCPFSFRFLPLFLVELES